MHIDLASLSPLEIYAAMTQTIVPRPVAWILTENENASFNLAPYSYFNAISSAPPMGIVSVTIAPDRDIKDTRLNLETRGDCVIHIAHKEMAAAMTASSASIDRDVSEVTEVGLETVDMPGSRLPRLKDARVAYAGKLVDTKMINRQWLAFIEFSDIYIADDIVSEDIKGRLKVDAAKLDPIGRLGGGEYVTAGEVIYIERPA